MPAAVYLTEHLSAQTISPISGKIRASRQLHKHPWRHLPRLCRRSYQKHWTNSLEAIGHIMPSKKDVETPSFNHRNASSWVIVLSLPLICSHCYCRFSNTGVALNFIQTSSPNIQNSVLEATSRAREANLKHSHCQPHCSYNPWLQMFPLPLHLQCEHSFESLKPNKEDKDRRKVGSGT